MSVHYLTKVAIREGWMPRMDTCEQCGGRRRVVAHHDDYSKPLEIRWLCAWCHRHWHKENGTGKHRERAGMHGSVPDNTATRYEQLQQLKAKGMNYSQIGREAGISRERVRQILGNANRAEAMSKRIEEQRDAIASMRLQGKGTKEIYAATGIPPAHLAKIANLPAKAPRPIPHGTQYGYRRGCKCSDCMKANSEVTNLRMHKIHDEGRCVRCGEPSKTWNCPACQHKMFPPKGRRVGRSGIKGIAWHEPTNVWRIVRYVEGKQKVYKTFQSLEDAKIFNEQIGWTK